MSQPESDISWQVLRRIVQDWAGASAELDAVKTLYGGSISTTLLLTTKDGSQAVLKISPYRVDRSYEHEAHYLGLLRAFGVPTPRIYQCKVGTLEDPNSYLLMEFMPGVDLNEAKRGCSSDAFDQLQRHLAELAVAIHRNTSDTYGRVTSEQSPKFSDWAPFYHDIFDPIWAEAQKLNLLPVKTRKHVGRLHERLDRLIGHNDMPRLVHWDLWASNLLAAPDDQGNWRITAVLDPACKFAHAEAEIAYMDLFHTITPAFSKAYQQHFKLEEAYHRIRKPIYQLYPLLNHVCIFGAEYMKPLMSAIERTSALV